MEPENRLDNLLSHDELLNLLQRAEGFVPQAAAAPRRASEDNAPLSFAQERLWLIEQIHPGLSVYHSPHAIRIEGEFDIAIFRRVMTEVLRRHEVLRSSFAIHNRRLCQRVQPLAPANVPLTDFRGLWGAEQNEAVRQLVQEETATLFNFATGPFLRSHVIRLKDREHLVLLTTHHIVSDRWSTGVLVKELGALYSAYKQGHGSPLPELSIQYRDYAQWQRRQLQGDVLREGIEYWRSAIGDPNEVLQLPVDYAPGKQRTFRASSETVVIEAGLAHGLELLGRRCGATVFMTLLAAFQTLLHRYSRQPSIRVGTPISGRDTVELEKLIGIFVNTLVLRANFADDPTFLQLLQQVRETVLGAFTHKEVPFEKLVEELVPPRDLASTPLFQAMFVFEERAGRADARGAADLQSFPIEVTSTPFELSLIVREEAGAFICAIEYSLELFKPETIRRMAEHWSTLLASIVGTPEARVSELEMLTASEWTQVIKAWNNTGAEFPRDKCIHQLFEEQVRKTPHVTAAVFEGRELTYVELNNQANQLAHYLKKLGVNPDSAVAICAERSLEMLTGILAVLKAGGAYVPLEPSYPVERIRWMLEDSAPAVLLTQSHLPGLFSGIEESLPVIDLASPIAPWNKEPETNPDCASHGLTPNHLAYVIYTSGSTGRPKGVMIQHRGLVNRLVWMQSVYELAAEDAVLQKTPFSFDVSVWELLWPLITGARLVIARPEGHKDPAYLAETIQQNHISTIHFVPSMLQAFLEHAGAAKCSTLKRIVCSGEALPAAVAQRLQDVLPQAKLHNLYGPTEATVDVTSWSFPGGTAPKRIPIGSPVANTQIYILEPQGKPASIGITGELYIGGVQVARGYCNRADLTADKFLPDPFAKEAGARMYKTGDLARWLDDGTIEFLGRNDFQVKIRGFRIELEEIEARLLEHPAVREAVVIARENRDGERRLAAYYTAVDAVDAVDAEQLRAHLLKKLPDYMVPPAYVCLQELPLTPNGKLDRKALPRPDSDSYIKRRYEEPYPGTETVLAALWAELLHLDRVGRHDNFFELGGHSLLAVTVIERLRQMGLHVDVRALFAAPTLADLAASIGGESKSIEVPENRITLETDIITPEMLPLIKLSDAEIDRIVSTVPGGAGNIQDIYPLAPLQEGILFHSFMEGEGDPYLMDALIAFSSRARLDAYLEGMQAVIDRHDILRTAVLWEGLPEPAQVVWRKARLSVEEVSLSPEAPDAADELYARFNPRRYRMDLRQAPLVRAFIAEDAKQGRWLLLLLLHHLVDDFTSLKKMQDEIQAHMLGRFHELPKPRPFRNLVAQARLAVSREEHESFFRKLLGDVEEPTLPFGLVDAQGDGTKIEEIRSALDRELSSRIREAARVLGVSAASIFHLAWALVLGRVAKRRDVVFGTVLFGRMHGGTDAGNVMGMFINTLPVRIRIDGERVDEGVRRTHQLLAELMLHEHASLALAQRCSGVASPAPLFSALLNYRRAAEKSQNDTAEIRQGWEGVELLRGEERTNYPFALSIDDAGQDFGLTAHAPAWINPQVVCDYLGTALQSLVQALETSPSTPVCCLEVLPEKERRQLALDWNSAFAEFPQSCIHQLFELHAAKAPGAPAVVYKNRSLTYGELNQKANRLAHYVRQFGVKADVRVGICADRGFEMVVAVLAVLKAGGTYVPLDPAYPPERLRWMVEDSAPALVLTELKYRERFAGADLPVIDLKEESLWSNSAETNLQSQVTGITPGHLAYVIYTSGSTGMPKGVLIEHRGVMNVISESIKKFEVKESSRIVQLASLNFDASVLEIFTALLSGAALYLVEHDILLSSEALSRFLKDQGVTTMAIPPSLLRLVPAGDYPALHSIVVGGEACSAETAARWSTGRLLFNAYAPTEATIYATLMLCASGERRAPSIGRPIANMQAYILDEYWELAPVGVTGELFISGVGVARGYLNRPDLTAEQFVPSPYGPPGARMYRTGDLARWRADGTLEFLGRNDFQVKVRGFRIELGEIEARLTEHPGVREAVVLAREDVPGDKRLVAYYTAEKDGDAPVNVSPEQLREHVKRSLPGYMAPAGYVRLEQMPLTGNGKVDRGALPAPVWGVEESQREKPRNHREQVLVEIWGKVLGLEGVGVEENFFELGGDSILSIQIVSRALEAGLRITSRQVFQYPTIAELAGVAEEVEPREEKQAGESAQQGEKRARGEGGGYTPSDFPLANLNQDQLDELLDTITSDSQA